MFGLDFSRFKQLFGFHNDNVASHCDQRIEVAGRALVIHVSVFVHHGAAYDAYPRAQGEFEKIILAVYVEHLFAVCHLGADSGRRKYAAQSVAARSDSFYQRALRHETHLEGACRHLGACLRVGAHVRGYDLFDHFALNQLGYAAVGN